MTGSVILATTGQAYDGILLKIEKDFDGMIERDWNEFRNLEECLDINTNGFEPGVYRCDFDIKIKIDHPDEDGYPISENNKFTEVSWPDCEPIND